MTKNFVSLAGASAVAFILGIATLPGTADAGFFEQLFGVVAQPAPQAAPAPSYGYDMPQSYGDAPVRRRARRKVVADDKPKLQKPTDLMHDVTLQNGDAVMMKGGLQVYVGDDGDPKHSRADFEPIDEVGGLTRQERKALVAMDTSHNDPQRERDPVASGRSAAVASPVSQGHEIVDARGKTLRYVGP